MDVRVPRDAQVERLRALGPAGRLELGCELIDLARELSGRGPRDARAAAN